MGIKMTDVGVGDPANDTPCGDNEADLAEDSRNKNIKSVNYE